MDLVTSLATTLCKLLPKNAFIMSGEVEHEYDNMIPRVVAHGVKCELCGTMVFGGPQAVTAHVRQEIGATTHLGSSAAEALVAREEAEAAKKLSLSTTSTSSTTTTTNSGSIGSGSQEGRGGNGEGPSGVGRRTAALVARLKTQQITMATSSSAQKMNANTMVLEGIHGASDSTKNAVSKALSVVDGVEKRRRRRDIGRVGTGRGRGRGRRGRGVPVDDGSMNGGRGLDVGSTSESRCPMCNLRLTGNEFEDLAHVNGCLNDRQRVEAIGTAVEVKPGDENEELDIEGDETTETFGAAQFGAGDLTSQFLDGADGGASGGGGAVDVPRFGDSGPPPAVQIPQYHHHHHHQQPPMAQGRDDVNIMDDESDGPREHVHGMGVGGGGKGTEAVGGTEGSHQAWLLAALQSEVQTLRKAVDNPVRCHVCLNPYTDPTVSITCWHVHCKDCWLATLGAKRVCPQCSYIISPEELRRIFL